MDVIILVLNKPITDYSKIIPNPSKSSTLHNTKPFLSKNFIELRK